jgi:hypothetical protein
MSLHVKMEDMEGAEEEWLSGASTGSDQYF